MGPAFYRAVTRGSNNIDEIVCDWTGLSLVPGGDFGRGGAARKARAASALPVFQAMRRISG